MPRSSPTPSPAAARKGTPPAGEIVTSAAGERPPETAENFEHALRRLMIRRESEKKGVVPRA